MGLHDQTTTCPYCGEVCYADWADVGVGFVQCGPFYCENCRASEIGPFDDERELTPEEKKFGWYKPGSPVGSSANSIEGIPIDYKTAMRVRRWEGILGIDILDSSKRSTNQEED